MGVRPVLFLALALTLGLQASVVRGGCRQALALALDISGSVDTSEYRLQMQGVANALRHPDVVAALMALPSAPVELAVFEWSGGDHQNLLIPWTAITSTGDLDRIAGTLFAARRGIAPPVTALGQAMSFGVDLLDQRQHCSKRTLDISGDGRNNSGPQPRDLRPVLKPRGVTVNALVIGSDAPHGNDLRQVEIGELSSYFRAEVILGPDAFVETALGFEDYEAAMVRKLRRELEGLAVSDLSPLPPSRYSGSGRSSTVRPASAHP